MKEPIQNLTDKEFEQIVVSWLHQGHEVTSSFFDEDGNLIEISRFQRNVLPTEFINERERRKLISDAKQ